MGSLRGGRGTRGAGLRAVKLLRRILWWVRARLLRTRVRRQVEEDIRTHIELDAERLRGEGVAAAEALRRARVRFGDRDHIRDRMLAEAGATRRAPAGPSLFEVVALHLRQAAHALRANRAPLFLVILTLATAIAVNTLMVSVAHSVLLGDGGVSDPSRVMTVYAVYPELAEGMRQQPINARELEHIQEAASADAVAGFKAGYFNLTGHGNPRRLHGMLTTPGLFEVAGVRPLLGPGFADVRTGEERVVVLSWALWRDLGADPALVGSTLRLNEEPYTITGVMPEGFAFPRGEDVPSTFRFPRHPDVWVPYALPARGPSDLGVVARLRSGAGVTALQEDLKRAQEAFQAEVGATSLPWSLRAVAMREQATAPIRPAVLLLLVATTLVVLVAMGNVIGVGIARGEARAGELAVRMALGSGRGGAVAFVLAESTLIALLTAAVALGLDAGLGAVVRRAAPEGMPGIDQVHLSPGLVGLVLALSFAGALCLAVGAVARLRGRRVADMLRGTRSAGGRTTRRTALGLVTVQLGTTLVLLCGSMVMTRTVLRLLTVDPGFDAHGVLTAEITLPEATYPDTARMHGVQRALPPEGPDAAVPRFHRRLVQSLTERPGIEVAAVANPLPFSGGQESTVYWVDGMEKPETLDVVDYTAVGEGYFRAMGIPFLEGHGFTSAVRHDGDQVVVVSASLAKRFPEGKALGHRMKLGGAPDAPYAWLRVVGVVPDVKRMDLTGPAHAEMYVHETQGGYTSLSTARLVLRVDAGADPAAAAATVRAAVSALDPTVPVERIEPMEALLARSMSGTRFAARLVLGFAFLALLITALGLYSAISYAVTTRRRELALRVAVGASSAQLVRAVLGEMAVALGTGLALAGIALWLGSGLLDQLLFGVAPLEPLSLLSAAGILSATVLLAAQGPVRRALGIEPARVLSGD